MPQPRESLSTGSLARQAETEDSSQLYPGTMFPVFVTADVPLKTINACLSRSHAFCRSEGTDSSLGLYLVTGPDFYHTACRPTISLSTATSPFPTSISSPYLNKSIPQLFRILRKERKKSRRLLDSGSRGDLSISEFINLDEQTAKDSNTAFAVSDLDDEVQTARVEFDLCSTLLRNPNIGQSQMNEGVGTRFLQKDGTFFYETKKWEDWLYPESR